MEERTLLALMVFSSVIVLAETIAQKVFALYFFTNILFARQVIGGIGVAGQLTQVTPLVTTTCGASGVLCRDFRALGHFKAFLVGCWAVIV